LHKLRSRRQLAIVRELWQTRDQVARTRDIAPGRVLPDAAIVAAAAAAPRTTDELLALPAFRGPAARRQVRTWLGAVQRASALPADQLPLHSLPSDAPPPPRAWADRDPDAAARLTFARTRLSELSQQLAIPVENLMTPDVVRRALWQPPAARDVDDVLARHGARAWQVELVGPVVREALGRTATDTAVQEEPAEQPTVEASA
jgi:ribonuclease D